MVPKQLLKRIDEKLKLIDSNRPLSANLVRKLKEQFSIEMTYNSNAIEGNRLTLKETFLVINEGITVKGKSLKDHLEAKNHYEALNYLYDLVEHEKRQTVSERLIRSLQQLVIKDLEEQGSGEYRKGSVMIPGSAHRPPDAIEVPQLMNDLIVWVKKNTNKMHPVELAALAHHKLVNIHPFVDGNGRTARLFMNLLLMQQGFPLVILLKNDRKKYYRSLEKADKGDTSEFEKLIAQAVERSMNLYLKVIKTGASSDEKLHLLSSFVKKSGFSEKYLNLLARSGKLEAHKEGRNWLTSQKAIEEYMKNRERKRKRTKK